METTATDPAAATHDRITQAYLGELGPRFMERTQRRIHWMCGQVRGRRVLDIGCSQGIVGLLLAREGHEVTGIDSDAKAIEEARGYLAAEPPEVQARLSLVHGDAAELPADGAFDTVILGEILEHLDDPAWLIDVAAGQLAPGGRVVVTVPFGVNDFPDHRQTFYLSAPHALLSRRFEMAQVEMLGRWVGFVGELPADSGTRPAQPLDGSAVPLLEEGMRRLERVLLDERDLFRSRAARAGERLGRAQEEAEELRLRLTRSGGFLARARARAKELALERDGHRARAGALESALQAARARIRALEVDAELAEKRGHASAKALRGLQQRLSLADKRVDAGAKALRDLQARLEKVEKSTSFRLGHTLVRAVKAPGRITELPAAARRLGHELRHGRQTAWPSPKVAIAKKLQPPAQELSVLDAVPRRGPREAEPVPGRLAYVLHNSLPWSSGGYATRAHGLALGMRDAGLEVVCITRPGFPLDIKGELTAEGLPLCDEVEGIPYRRLLAPRRADHIATAYMLAAADALEAELRQLRPEWVIAASNHVTGLPSLIAARRLGVPFFYEVRGFWEVTRQSRQPTFERSNMFKVQEKLETEVARRADHVFTLAGPMLDELVRRGVDPQSITLLPNSCDPARFTPRGRDAALAARLGIPPTVPVIGYIGTFVQYEGLEDLVAACGILLARGRDFRLMLIGNENASGTETGPITAEITRIAAETGLADRLIMPGRVPHDEVAAYYSLIDVAPFPRKPQPVTEMVSPMKPLEALAMEKAVVVSSVAALVEMIADEKTGLVFAKGSVESLADVLDRLIGDPALRDRLGKNGRAWVARDRTWAEMGRRVAACLAPFAEPGAERSRAGAR